MPYASKILKLSEKGWSLNERYLLKDENSMCYYSKIPDKPIIGVCITKKK